MTITQAISSLRKAGTAQNRKVYARHGVTAPMFGVSFAHLGKMTRQMKCDHVLAEKLWNCGNHDARVLATMIADPEKLDSKALDRWASELDSSALAGLFAGLVARSPLAWRKHRVWKRSGNRFASVTAWSLVCSLAQSTLSDAEGRKLIAEIERKIHHASNRTRYSMNSALIALGGYRASLAAPALAAAKRIGKVEVDHGETCCKTPDATAYILKMRKRKKRDGESRGRPSVVHHCS